MLDEISVPSLIAEGSRIQGELTFSSAVSIFGVVEGEVVQQSKELVQVGRNGWVHGRLTAEGPILIEGRVDGEVVSAVSIKLSATAVVKGRLVAPSVDIRAGALFEGELAMKADETPRRIKHAA